MPSEKRKEAARDMEVYSAMVDYLKEVGEYDNTVILFLSDNGANGVLPTAYPRHTDEYLSSVDNSMDNRGLANSFIDVGPGQHVSKPDIQRISFGRRHQSSLAGQTAWENS